MHTFLLSKIFYTFTFILAFNLQSKTILPFSEEKLPSFQLIQKHPFSVHLFTEKSQPTQNKLKIHSQSIDYVIDIPAFLVKTFYKERLAAQKNPQQKPSFYTLLKTLFQYNNAMRDQNKTLEQEALLNLYLHHIKPTQLIRKEIKKDPVRSLRRILRIYYSRV